MPRRRSKLGKGNFKNDAEIDIYANFLKGNAKVDIKRPAPAAYKARRSVGVVPFATSPDETAGAKNAVQVSMTRGAGGILTTLALAAKADTLFGHEYDSTKVTDPQAGFYPALAKVTLYAAGVAIDDTGLSAITGRPRRYKPGRSGSIPFGRGSVTAQPESKAGKAQTVPADIDYNDARAAIKGELATAANASNIGISMSFENEVIRSIPAPADFYSSDEAVAPVL